MKYFVWKALLNTKLKPSNDVPSSSLISNLCAYVQIEMTKIST
jgi:hypothetical protein